MILKASHVVVRRHTVGTEKAGAVAAPCNRLLPGLAARAQRRATSDVGPVHHVHKDYVHGQLSYAELKTSRLRKHS